MKILAILEKIEAQSKKKSLILDATKNCELKQGTNVKSTYIKCGAPYFKDALSAPAPFNEDYLYRKNVLNEFFPFDQQKTSSRWKTSDKVALVNGAKKQMINYIKSQQSLKYSQEVRRTRGRIKTLRFISQCQDLNKSSMLEIYLMIKKDYPDFAINWNLISFNDILSRHSVPECMGIWYSYLRPDINREPFTEDENIRISSIIAESNFNNWNDVAASLDNRSALQTFIYFHSIYTRYCPSNVRWSDEEDATLLTLADKYSINGVINWQKIGQVIVNRNKTQCYNRYLAITKRQGIKKGFFTPSEDRKIIKFVEKFGKRFDKMPKDFIDGRTQAQIRTHYSVALNHQGNINPWTNEEDKQLVDFVENGGDNRWAEIADILKTHNRLSCRTRYLTIKKYLAKNPNSKLEDVPHKTKKVTAFQRASVVSIEGTEDEDSDANAIAVTHQRMKGLGLLTFEKFKAANPGLYNLMRTAFKYDLGAKEVSTDKGKLLILMGMFNVKVNKHVESRLKMLTTNQKQKFDELKNFRLKQVLLDEMKFVTAHTQFLMPPNFNTVIGWRALSIKIHEDPLPEDSELVIENPNKEYKESLETFQKLFFSLFYWSAMLKKIDNAVLNETHFLKYPKANMSSTEILKMLKNRNLTVKTGMSLKRQPENLRNYQPKKKQKT